MKGFNVSTVPEIENAIQYKDGIIDSFGPMAEIPKEIINIKTINADGRFGTSTGAFPYTCMRDHERWRK